MVVFGVLVVLVLWLETNLFYKKVSVSHTCSHPSQTSGSLNAVIKTVSENNENNVPILGWGRFFFLMKS